MATTYILENKNGRILLPANRVLFRKAYVNIEIAQIDQWGCLTLMSIFYSYLDVNISRLKELLLLYVNSFPAYSLLIACLPCFSGNPRCTNQLQHNLGDTVHKNN